MTKARRIAWLLYKRLRTGIGVTLGFAVMYGAYTRTIFTDFWAWLPIALGFWFIHIHGDLFNDYYDYEEDKRNKRTDKWTTNGLVSKRGILRLSVAVALTGLAVLATINIYVFLTGLAFALTSILYSHPALRAKRFELNGYLLITLPIFLFPVAWNTAFGRPFSAQDLLVGLFFGFHYLYLCCQKDSTDPRDCTNIFIRHGWQTASLVCIAFGVIASALFLSVATTLALFAVWTQNVVSKIVNLRAIYTKNVSRSMRARIILSEFATPYLYLGASML